MLSKRDTFVRYLDPLKTTWQDANGVMRLDLPRALLVFGFKDTPENRELIMAEFKKVWKQAGVEKFVYRKQPDSPEFWYQKVSRP